MLEWIISSAVLIAIVIVLRLILKGKMSLRLQYALWAVVLVRLLVPFSFGSTAVSVQNVVARPAVEAPQASDTFAYSAQNDTLIKPVIDEKTKPQLVYPGTTDPQALDKINKCMEEVASRFSTEVSAEAQPLTVNEILNIVWASGAGLIALWLLITNLRFYFKLRKSRERLEVDGAPLPVYVTDQIDTPCLFGLIKPKIYVTPDAAADETVLRYSVEHEATHRRHGDHVWSLLRGLCLAVHWYNPLVWVAAVLSRNDAELACDEATIRRIGEEHRADYGRTLLQLTCEKRPAIFVAATTMTGSGRTIKERIKLIVKKPKTAIITLIAIVLVIAIAVGCTFTGAKTEAENECSVTLVKDQSYFSDFEVVDGQVSFDCVLCLRNAAEEPQTVCIYGNFDEDRQNGLVRENVLMAHDRSNQSSLEFCVPAGAEETFSVRFTGTFAGNNEKQNRLLPELEIVLSSETTPAFNELGKLDASDIPALLDAIDLNEAMLTFHSEADADHPVGTHRAYPAAASLEAAYYMEHMTKFPWENIPTENNAPSEVRGDYVRLAAPHVTVTYYQREQDNGCCYSVQTDQAEVWFHYPSEMYKNPPGVPELRAEDRFDYYEMCLWYAEAELTTLYGGSGRLLTQEELSGIRCEFMTTTKVENGITMIKFQDMAYFFTSTYSDVRNLNAREFLRWFPSDDFAAEDEIVVREWGEHVLIRHIPRSAVNEVLMKYAGITAEEMNTNWFEEAGYDPETDCFLVEAGYAGMPYQTFFPVVGVENGDVITLWGKADYDNGLENPAYRLTLEKNGDGWRILSYTAEGEESGYSVPTSEPDEPPAELTAAVESLCDSGDISLTLFLADIGEWGTYTGDTYTSDSLRRYIYNYNWTLLDAPTTEPSDYWLSAVSADGTKRMTFWDDGGAGTVEYSDGSSSSFWKASRVYPGGMSVAEYVRSQFDRLETDFSRVSFRIDGTAEDAAEYFATTAVGEHMRSLEPGNGFGADDYEVIEWRVIEVSEDGRMVKGSFTCAVVPWHPTSTEIRAGNTREGTGQYAGKTVFDRTFVLELQDDGNWHCVEIGTG